MELENFPSCSDRSHSAQFFHPNTLIQDIAHYSFTWLKIHIHHFFIFSPFFSMWIGSRRLEYIYWIGAVSSPLWSEAKTKGPVGDQRWLRAFCCFLSTFNSWRIQWLFGFLPFYQGKGWINATIELSYMEPPQVLFISLSFWKWHTLTKGTYARVKAHFSRRQYLLACFLAQHMSDVCVRPLSPLWLVALSMKRYILGMIPDTGNCENEHHCTMA